MKGDATFVDGSFRLDVARCFSPRFREIRIRKRGLKHRAT